jgi:septum formation protein
MQLILASTSPRRRELLATLGLEFSVVGSAPLDEAAELNNGSGELTRRLARLARLKGAAAAEQHPQAVVLSADTVVEIDGVLLGKPRDVNDAKSMLTRLSGREHRVHTGVAVQRYSDEMVCSDCETTGVYFTELSEPTITRYVELARPLDKAGAYAIQGLGAVLVKRIEGDYSNVVGLPLPLTARLLGTAGIAVLA